MSIDPTRIDLHSPRFTSTDPRVRRMDGITAHGNMQFDVPFITEVAPNLWLGGCTNGLVLPQDVKHLVSLYPWERYTVRHELDSKLTVRMYDSLDQAADQAVDVADWVLSAMKHREYTSDNVLVHCQAGLNRSSLVVALAMLRTEVAGWPITGEEAIDALRGARSPAVLCNPAFEAFVRNYN